jgi:hypothetical protein
VVASRNGVVGRCMLDGPSCDAAECDTMPSAKDVCRDVRLNYTAAHLFVSDIGRVIVIVLVSCS